MSQFSNKRQQFVVASGLALVVVLLALQAAPVESCRRERRIELARTTIANLLRMYPELANEATNGANNNNGANNGANNQQFIPNNNQQQQQQPSNNQNQVPNNNNQQQQQNVNPNANNNVQPLAPQTN